MIWTAQRLALVTGLRAGGLDFGAIGERFGLNAERMRQSYYAALRRAAREGYGQETCQRATAGVPRGQESAGHE